jgi:hypothetical protein
MKRAAVGVVIVAALVAVTTAILGWWTVPLAGAVWGLRAATPRPAVEAGLGAGIGWALLLAVTALQGDVARLSSRVGGVIAVSGLTFALITLAFGILLAASAASVASVFVRGRRSAATTT